MKFPQKSPVTGTEYTKAEYEALTTEQKIAAGFVHDPAVVYRTYPDKIEDMAGDKKITLDPFVTDDDGKKEKIPTGTKYNGLEEAHVRFANVKAEASN